MPLVDKPLDELREYHGSSPCPADLDDFWEKSLAEMHAVNPDVRMSRAKFQVDFADCFDLTFTGIGGSKIYAKYIRPLRSTAPCPAVVMFHGYSGHSGDWNDKLNYVAAGFCVVAMDVRGQGGRSEDRTSYSGTNFRGHIIRGLNEGPEKLLFRQIYLDTAQLAGIVMGFDEVDASRVAAIGASQGGGLSLACAALEPRVNRTASLFPFLSDYKRVWDLDLDKQAYDELRRYFQMYDPQHKREDEIFYRLGYIDIQNLVRRIEGKVLMGITLMDVICPPSTQFAAYNKIRSDKRCEIYPDFGHEIYVPEYHDSVFQFLLDMKFS